MPQGHAKRDVLDKDQVSDLPDYLSEYVTDFDEVAGHRETGYGCVQPLLRTLDAFDRMTGRERDPAVTEIILTLDLIDRAAMAERSKSKPAKPKPSTRRR